MLSDNAAIATVAVRNLETAKKFYEAVWFNDPDGNASASARATT